MSTTELGTDSSGQGRAPLKKMIAPLVILGAVVAVILGGIFAWHLFMGKMMKKYMGAAATAPQTVSTAVAASASWQAHSQAIGSLRAVRGADLAAQIAGVVDQMHIDSGTEVAAGTVLLKLRANDDPAKLAQLQAAAALAEQTYKRDQEQFAAQAISQAVLDTDVSTLKSARAQVAAQQALIDEKTVKAPFAGTSRHPAGRRRPVPDRRHHRGDPAGARSHPHRLLRAAAGACASEGRAGRDGNGGHLSGHPLYRHDRLDQLQG